MKAKLREIKETLRRHRHTPIDEQGRWLGAMMKGNFACFAVPTNAYLLSAFRITSASSVPKSAATQPAASADVGTDGPTYQAVPTVTARAAPVAKPSVPRQTLEVGAECVSSARSDLCGGWSAMAISTAIKTYHPGCRHSSECGRPYARARHLRAPGTIRRGHRPWHVQTLLVREPGGPTADRQRS